MYDIDKALRIISADLTVRPVFYEVEGVRHGFELFRTIGKGNNKRHEAFGYVNAVYRTKAQAEQGAIEFIEAVRANKLEDLVTPLLISLVDGAPKGLVSKRMSA